MDNVIVPHVSGEGIEIGDEGVVIREDELQWRFTRASGPGGQNVNKVSSAVQLRFDTANSPALAEDVRARLMRLAGRRMTNNGVLVIDSERFRSQARNRQDALERLAKLIQKAAKRPKPRKKTRPTAASKRRRLNAKRERGDVKGLRDAPRDET